MKLDRTVVRIKMIEQGIRYQYELAELVGVSANTVSDWLDGTRQPGDLDHIEGLCRALDCEPNDILVREASLEL